MDKHYKTLVCDLCHGDGGYLAANGKPLSETGESFYRCETCGGSGQIEQTEDEYWDAVLNTAVAVGASDAPCATPKMLDAQQIIGGNL